MAAVDQTLTGNEVSAEFTPTVAVSDVVIEEHGPGTIELQGKTPNGAWYPVASHQWGFFNVNTPDVAILYRFVAKDVTTTARVYMGP